MAKVVAVPPPTYESASQPRVAFENIRTFWRYIKKPLRDWKNCPKSIHKLLVMDNLDLQVVIEEFDNFHEWTGYTPETMKKRLYQRWLYLYARMIDPFYRTRYELVGNCPIKFEHHAKHHTAWHGIYVANNSCVSTEGYRQGV